MVYDPTDPRSGLATHDTPPSTPPADGCAEPQFFEFDRLPPDELTPRGSRTWYVRAQNFALCFTMARSGEVLERIAQPDEYVVLLPQDGACADITANEERVTVQGASIAVVPPGDSHIVARSDTRLVRLITCRSNDVLARCRNDEAYREHHPNVAPFVAWPEPGDGHRVRVYPVRDFPYAEGRFARIFRCSTFMVNFFDPELGPRNPDKLSPHTHDDFEQCSLVVNGAYVHHLRTPWSTRLSEWREDVHKLCGGPSLVVIPPPAVHTSQSVGHVRNHLIDIFCPPRQDFSQRPGWVLNANEYPVPDEG